MTIEPAVADDAPALLELQRLCYRREAELYGDFSIPPLTQTLDSLRRDIETQLVLVAKNEDGIVGSARAYLDRRTCYIGRVIVHPDSERNGLGSRLMAEVEERFPETDRFELFTGHRSEGNLRFYERLGYQPFRRQDVSPNLTLVYLKKHRR